MPIDLSRTFRSIKTNGAVRLDSVISLEMCEELNEFIDAILNKMETHPPANIHSPRFRVNLPLPLEGPVKEALKSFSVELEAILLELVGPNPLLVELGALISYPGAARQPPHPDSENHCNPFEAKLFTIFIALSDISRSHGPLEAWEGSHKLIHDYACQDNLSVLNCITFDIKTGQAILMDSRTWHRGTDNFSNEKRPVFYFTYQGNGIEPDGPTWTIDEQLVGQFTLQSILLL